MIKFRFFVKCKGWAAGGYYNTHYAENRREMNRILSAWNDGLTENDRGYVTLINAEEVTLSEFAEDYIY